MRTQRRVAVFEQSALQVPAAVGATRLRRMAASCAACILVVVGLVQLTQAACARPDEQDRSYVIDRWEVEQGLPENSATAMVQTADGYLWFGTFNGLVRFDGVRFTVFDTVNTPELPDAGIANLHLDRSGRLWVSTLKGLVVRSAAGWRRIEPVDGWKDDVAKTFSERSNGDLLITAFDGRVLEYVGGQLNTLPPPPGPPGVGYSGAVDRDGRWWIAKVGFIGCWDGHTWVHKVDVPQQLSIQIGSAAARDGGLWFLVGGELRKYLGEQEVKRVTLQERVGAAWQLFEDSSGNVWICTIDSGVCRVSPQGQMVRWDATNGLAHNGARFVFEDSERNLWIGTSGGGLARFRPSRFQHFGAKNGVGVNAVSSVWPEQTGTWIGTYGSGLYRLQSSRANGVPLGAAGGPAKYVQSVLSDHAGRVWVGTFGDGLFLMSNSGTRQIPRSQSGGENVIALFEDWRGRIWISGGRSVTVYEGDEFRLYCPESNPTGRDVCCFAEAQDGTIWMSNLSGVFRLVDGTFSEVTAPYGKSITDVLCIRVGTDGSVWMGSRSSGLLRWRPNRLDRVDASVGLPVRSIAGIMEDQRGYWWMASSSGVVRAEHRQLEAVADGKALQVQCQLLGMQDGMASTECASGRQPVCGRDTEGVMWFATTKGVVSIDPEKFTLNSLAPQTHIEEFLYERPGPDREFEGTSAIVGRIDALTRQPNGERLTIPAGSRHLQIRYTATSFTAPDRVRFQTMLEGRNSTWTMEGTNRVEYFHDLPPGEYTFRVRASNNDGVWNEPGSQLAFEVLPFYWQTSWFKAGAAALLVIVGASGTWWFMQRRLEHAREHLELVQQRGMMAHLSRVTMLGELSGSLAHELNQPLTAILGNAQAAQRFLTREPVDLNELRDILTDIVEEDKRAGDVIHRLRLLLKKGEVEQTSLDIGEVVRDVLKLVRSDVINHGVSVAADLDSKLPLVLGDRVQLQQVLVNLIINSCDAMAGIPSSARRLSVMARLEGETHVRVSVSDSGTGITPEHMNQMFQPFFSTKASGMGLGLAVCRTIVTTNGGRLWVANNPVHGCTFHFTLPVVKGRPA